LANKITWTNTKTVYFGGRVIPPGSIITQFETENFGYTHYITPDGVIGLCNE
jgi:hypothetical protein